MEEKGYGRTQTDFSLEESLPHANTVNSTTGGTGDIHCLSGSVSFFNLGHFQVSSCAKEPSVTSAGAQEDAQVDGDTITHPGSLTWCEGTLRFERSSIWFKTNVELPAVPGFA